MGPNQVFRLAITTGTSDDTEAASNQLGPGTTSEIELFSLFCSSSAGRIQVWPLNVQEKRQCAWATLQVQRDNAISLVANNLADE
jgi:hypothetical protein